jgi:hypothetical protein
MQTDREAPSISLGLVLEKFGPLVLSLIVVVALIVFRVRLLAHIAAEEIKPENLYSSVFNWSAIQVGFAFGVYGFVLTKSDGFVGAVRATIAMKRFMTYVRRGTVGGFLLTIASIPIAVMSPSPSGSTVSYYALALWFGLFVWTFLAFLRIAFIFGRLSTVPDQEPFYGA